MTNDSVLEEEAERREIDSKQGRATGEERKESPSLTSTEALKRASRRLQRRLDRAATALERALAYRKELTNIPAAGIARQIWMAHIAAFLTGREAPTSDGDPVVCLHERDFAKYILRVCRALSGGNDGGLLQLVSKESFAGPDGDSLKAGLAFLWTCLIFAVAEVTTHWASIATTVYDEDDEIEYASDVSDAIPELVGARFVLAIRPYCQKPDLSNISRRIPSWKNVAKDCADRWTTRLEWLADLIVHWETKGYRADADMIQDGSALKAGNLVFNDGLGITVLADIGENGKCYLVNVSRHDEKDPKNALAVFYSNKVRKVNLPSTVVAPLGGCRNGSIIRREPGHNMKNVESRQLNVQTSTRRSKSSRIRTQFLPRVGPGQGIDLGKERCKIGAI